MNIVFFILVMWDNSRKTYLRLRYLEDSLVGMPCVETYILVNKTIDHQINSQLDAFKEAQKFHLENGGLVGFVRDNTILHPDFCRQLSKIARRLPPTWDVIYLSPKLASKKRYPWISGPSEKYWQGEPIKSDPFLARSAGFWQSRIDLLSASASERKCSAHGYDFFGTCFCDAGFQGPRCAEKFREVLPCIDGNGRDPNDLTPESGTDRCFQSERNGRMVPPDGAKRWEKAQQFESALWAASDILDDRIETHQQGYASFSALGETPRFGRVLEVGSGPFTQTKGVLEKVPLARVDSLTFFDPSIDTYLTKVQQCSYKTGRLKRFNQAGFWPYPIETTSTMPTTQYDTVIAFNVITHVQNGYTWLEDLYASVKPGGLLLFSDYYFDGTDENFWYVPDAYYHPVRPFRRVYDHFFEQFETLYEYTDVLKNRPKGLHDTVGYWILRRKIALQFSNVDLQAILSRRGINTETMHKNDRARANSFQNVYTKKIWAHGKDLPLSGSGSTLEKTAAARRALKEVIVRYNIKSVVDAPCGDLTWMKTLFPFFKEHGVKYTGVDIVASEIERLRAEFPMHRFERLDMVNTILPEAELIFSRQALQHMNPEDNVRVINQWQRSGARFILQTTYRVAENTNYQSVADGTNSLINFETDPYNFPAPLETWVEQQRPSFTEVLALWKLPQAGTQRRRRQLQSFLPDAFKIIILTQRRHASLQRLLTSVDASHYGNHAVHLEIRVDYHDSLDHQKTIELSRAFEFTHGTKTVYTHDTVQGLQRAWFGAWAPASDSDRAVILEDDMELSPLWFTWLQKAWDNYGNRDDLGGISLQRQRLRASDGVRIMKQHDAPFLYRVVGSFGFSPNARHWKPFVTWIQKITNLAALKVDVPGTVSTIWHQKKPDSWEQFWIWWCWHEQALYTLYVHSQKGALIAHWAEPGVHSRSKGAPNDRLLKTTEPVLEAFPQTLTKFGWDFRYESDYEYDLTSPVYSQLRSKIYNLKQGGKPLLIKINSHPCAGKSTFIRKYKGWYWGTKLLDFDDYKGENRTSSLLQSYNTNTALFGSGDNKHRWHDLGQDDEGKFNDVVYVYVTPRLKQAKAQIISRQASVGSKGGWANTTRIMAARANLLSGVFSGGIQVLPLFYSFRESLDFCIGAYKASRRRAVLDTKNSEREQYNNHQITIWSNDFHIGTIANIKNLLQNSAHFIDKSLSGHCHLTKTCATDLKVLTQQNGISPPPEVRRAFANAYLDDPEFATVDIVMCFHPSAMCELFMPLNKRLFVIATTRYEMGRHSKTEWLSWNENLKRIAANPKNVVAANNLYDAKYIEYFTGIKPVVWPSVVQMEESYSPSSDQILVAEMHTPGNNRIWTHMRNVSPRFVSLRTKYPRYTYKQLCENTAIIHLPYQTSTMSLFEQYSMGIPILVPTPIFLWKLHNKYDLVIERTWDRVRTGKRPTGSVIAGVKMGIPDPNNDRDKDAFLYWVRYADFYQWPHIVKFNSWAHLGRIINNTLWTTVSKDMISTSKDMFEKTKRNVLLNINSPSTNTKLNTQ